MGDFSVPGSVVYKMGNQGFTWGSKCETNREWTWIVMEKSCLVWVLIPDHPALPCGVTVY